MIQKFLSDGDLEISGPKRRPLSWRRCGNNFILFIFFSQIDLSKNYPLQIFSLWQHIYVSCCHTCDAVVQVLLKGCYHIQQYSVPLLSVCSQLQNPGVVPLLRLTNFATQSPFWREMQRALVEGLVIF